MNAFVFKLQTKLLGAYILCIPVLFCLLACSESGTGQSSEIGKPDVPFLTVLGIAQDAGYPQAGCRKSCCQRVLYDPSMSRMVVSLGLVDPRVGHHWIFEATPDFTQQYENLWRHNPRGIFGGVFLTHGHIGHYTGLMYVGREVMGAKEIPTYVMARMDTFLRNNGPWSQLVKLQNITLHQMENRVPVSLGYELSVSPILVPHRDEFTETVGYHIQGPKRSALFIPDIDKWEKWEESINAWIQRVDYALLDATFFADGEIKGRSMSDIPHPFVSESMDRFKDLPDKEKSKVLFIHMNYTNPLLNPDSEAFKQVIEAGFQIAKQGQILEL